MNKFMKGRNVTLYLYAVLAAVLILVWKTGEVVNKKLAATQLHRLQPKTSKVEVVNEKSFYPVFVKQAAAVNADKRIAASDAEGLDSLFKKDEEVKPVSEVPVALPEPDPLLTIKQNTVVDAVSDNGAVINGRFYTIGSRIEELRFAPAGKGVVVPVMASVSGNKVTLTAGGKSVVLALAAQN
jgi:hypothetical protein